MKFLNGIDQKIGQLLNARPEYIAGSTRRYRFRDEPGYGFEISYLESLWGEVVGVRILHGVKYESFPTIGEFSDPIYDFEKFLEMIPNTLRSQLLFHLDLFMDQNILPKLLES